MPDPQVLYIVTAVVVLGLVGWVILVLSRSDGNTEGATVGKATAAARPAEAAPREPKREPARDKVDLPAKAKPWLHSHAEITDEAASSGMSDVKLEIEEDDEPTGPHALILVTAVGRTDPGLKRKHNEDAYAILEDHHLFVIADGMGRHAAGEVASRLCVEAITEAFQTSNFGPPRQPPLPRRAARLRGATLQANDRILAAANENEAYAGMGTTVVSAYFSPNNQRVYIAHVGDSRCYRLRKGTLTQLTTDHTLGAAGIVGKTAGFLSRAIGVEPDVEVDMTIESPMPGDTYLLCSDGLSRMVPAPEIEASLTAAVDLEEASKTLTDLANRGGGRDNITVILVRVDNAKVPPA
jgi:serine/threonine protein phosphatase PrpC